VKRFRTLLKITDTASVLQDLNFYFIKQRRRSIGWTEYLRVEIFCPRLKTAFILLTMIKIMLSNTSNYRGNFSQNA